MPIIQSAKKRVRTTKKATIRNAKTKRTMREAIKHFRATLVGKKGTSATALQEAQSTIDIAVKKNLLHKNTAARKKQQLAAEAKEAGVKPVPAAKKPAATKKAAPKKKAATKKPAVKKATTKKAPAKKNGQA